MNTTLQSQFDRVETALNTLIDSISAYNPSPSAAVALVAADDDLSHGLDQRESTLRYSTIKQILTCVLVATHQANYQTILYLRAQSDVLDNQIKSTLSSLAEIRKELIAAKPVTLSTNSTRPIDYKELLSYAQRIAPYTVPPTRGQAIPPPIEEKVISQEAPVNGTTTIKTEQPSTPGPLSTAPGDVQMTDAQQVPSKSHLETTAPEEGRAAAILTPAMRAWLEPSKSGITFTPWPAEEMIRRGALGRIQAALEEGKQPEGMDVAAEVEAERKRAENGEGVDDAAKTQEEERQEEVERQAREVGQVRRTQHAPARMKQETVDLGFDLYNPDEE